MLTTEDFSEFVKDMTNEDLSERVAWLKILWRNPSADERVLPYLEPLLDDKEPCVLGLPYIFGEVRWLAAHTLAEERKALGIIKPIRLKNVVKPVYAEEIIYATQQAKIRGYGGIEGLLKTLGILRDMGRLPLIDLELGSLLPIEPIEPQKVPAMMVRV